MRRTRLLTIVFLFVSCGGKNEETAPKTDAVRPLEQVNQLVGIAIIEPAKQITSLSGESAGLVQTIQVEIGQQVTKGQTILTLDNALETAQLRQAAAKLTTQQDAIETAGQNVETLRVQLRKAQTDQQRNQQLFISKALTSRELDDSRYVVTHLQQQIRASEALVRQARGQLGELQAGVQYARIVQRKKVVTAPDQGTLLSLDARVGQYLTSSQSIGEFAPAGPFSALTEIDELFALLVKVGQKAIIRPQGGSNVLSTGTVVLASPYLRKKSLFSDKTSNLEDRRVREVRVRLDDPTMVLLGARVECVIQVN